MIKLFANREDASFEAVLHAETALGEFVRRASFDTRADESGDPRTLVLVFDEC